MELTTSVEDFVGRVISGQKCPDHPPPTPSCYDTLFTFVKGDSYTIRITVKTSDGVAYNVSDWLFRLTVKAQFDHLDSQAPIKIDLLANTSETADAGIVYLTIPSSSTSSMQPGHYYCDIQLEITGYVYTVIVGYMLVMPEVTNRTGGV